MKRRRALIAFLLTLALPYAAAASIGEGLRCHHAGIGALVAGVMPMQHDRSMQHDHAAMQHDHSASAHAHHAGGHAAGQDNCDCPVKCDCAQHCVGNACGAALALQPVEIASAGGAALPVAGNAALIPEAWRSPAFRPPIAALPSAA